MPLMRDMRQLFAKTLRVLLLTRLVMGYTPWNYNTTDNNGG